MTAAVVDTARAPVRLRPTPDLEPPYDDERPAPARDATRPGPQAGPCDMELPLDWGRPGLHPLAGWPDHKAAEAARPGPARPRHTGWQAMADDVPLAIKQFVDIYVEVLNGRRPLRHLLPHTSTRTFRSIRRAFALRGRDWWPAGRQGLTMRAAPASPHGRPVSITARRLRTSEPAPGVVEVAVVLSRGEQVRAAAMRLEREGRRWTCTALEFVG
ncbi:MAG: hypothetical protein GEU94_09585 [Micromonosporaceae bacterium]|nr:hypothetical protein [Micromonosporaceae bacterium]